MRAISSSIIIENMTAAFDALESVIQSLPIQHDNEYWSSLAATISNVVKHTDDITKAMIASASAAVTTIPQINIDYASIADSIVRALQFIPEGNEQRQSAEEFVADIRTNSCSHWTRGEILALLALLVTLLFGILNLLPNKQLEQVIHREDQIITAIEDEKQAREEENQKLIDVINSLQDSITELSDVIDTLEDDDDLPPEDTASL